MLFAIAHPVPRYPKSRLRFEHESSLLARNYSQIKEHFGGVLAGQIPH